MSEVISWKLTKVILNAQLDKPRGMLTGTSNWACYVAGKIQEAYPTKPLANTTVVTQAEVQELLQMARVLERLADPKTAQNLSAHLQTIFARTLEGSDHAPSQS